MTNEPCLAVRPLLHCPLSRGVLIILCTTLFIVAGSLGGLGGNEAQAAPRDDEATPERTETPSEELGWLPSIALSYGVYSQAIEATTSATRTPILGEPSDSLLSEMFQIELQLHTPLQLVDFPLKPRLFLTGGVQIPLAEGNIAERFDESFDAPGFTFRRYCPSSVPGGVVQTCSVSVRNNITLNAAWYAGFGVDFNLPFGHERQFHISPAVEYYGISIQTEGEYQRSISGTGFDDVVEQANTVGNAEVFHGISTSLTASVDLFEERGLRWSMFLQGRVAFLLNDPPTSGTSNLGANTITFVSEVDDLVAQGTGGFRIQWTGKVRR